MKTSFLTLPLILAGGLLLIHFTNPHMQLYLDIAADKGNVTHWSVEGPDPAVWVQTGWGRKRTEAALAPGTKITITCSPARNGKPVGIAALRAFAPPSRMLFGSDFPAEDPAETLYQLEQRDLPPDIALALYRGAAEQLFPRLKAS